MPSLFQRFFGGATQRPSASAVKRPKRPPGPRRVNKFGPDRIALVGFHGKGFVIARPAAPHADWLQSRIQQLPAKVGAATNLTDGLRTAVRICEKTPPGILRRIWLLSDGYPNREESGIDDAVAAARQARVNVNTIGFGDEYDERLLRRISGGTHNGKFIPVRTMRELTAALVQSSGGPPRRRGSRRSETTVLAIDLSYSMLDPMEGRPKIEVVQDVLMQLLHYKQQCFS
ncbi:VWA domain-containing protein [Aeoliella sp. ICT_H6.2]|uniref:VWA domain-containing protein n=1 Tax=Aeoliella straminimaris TaxID=2954799 RepID=A0A9X2JFR8_9BACT|nr:vWA domain-containing protein [Aeoliella straminimaris]MCO6042688.1 VWA domain-containing protein [Aeoliella straminimaris]